MPHIRFPRVKPAYPLVFGLLPWVSALGLRPAMAEDVPSWLESARREVVAVETMERPASPLEGLLPHLPGEPGAGQGRGAGFRCLGEGLIVTSAHVVQDAELLRLRTSEGDVWPARVVGLDTASDLALLSVRGQGWRPGTGLVLAPDDVLAVGDPVTAIGHPLGLEGTVTRGIVSALERSLPLADRIGFIQTDAVLQPGSSGGPLLDGRGRVVGVNAAVARHMQGIGFAVPAKVARWVLSRLGSGRPIVRGSLSAAWREATSEASWHAPARGGVLLGGLAPGGAAARAGLRPGDRLLALAGRPVLGTADVSRFLLCTTPGETHEVRFERAGRVERVILTLDAASGEDGLRGELPADRRPAARP